MSRLISILLVFTPIFAWSEALPPYDAELLKAYDTNPAPYQTNHEQALKVVRAQSIRFYDELMKYFMAEMKMDKPPIDTKMLDAFNDYYKSLPTPVLVEMAHARNNVVLAVNLMSAVGQFQANHKYPVTVLNPPSFTPNPAYSPTQAAPDVTSTPEFVELQEKVAALEKAPAPTLPPAARVPDLRLQYITLGLAAFAMLVSLFALRRR